MKSPTRIISALPVLLLVLVGAFWLFQRSETLPPMRSNVVLISIDTCRADRLSCYGFPLRTTPNIDAIAREGVVFRDAIAPTPMTLPSHCSMMTGTRPPYHGVHDNFSYRLGESNVTLAEILKDNGYVTGAVVGAFVMDAKFGLAQGFESYDARFESSGPSTKTASHRPAGEVNRVAKQWLAGHSDRPFFLFLHYYDPHWPYEPPPPFSTRFPPAGSRERAAYAGEVAYVDHCVGEIKAELVRLGLYDSSLIVITSDHGESLGEHGEENHAWFVYHSTTRIPLVVKLPGRREARLVEDKVALIDLAPTILDRLGLPEAEEMQGRSLDPYLAGRKPEQPERYVYSESLLPTIFGCSSLLALETRQWKYIQSTKPELYDLITDPGEANNVLSAHAEQARSMRNRLKALLEERTRIHEKDAAFAPDRETVDRLADLGYVGGGQRTSFEFETDKEDPKDFLPYYAEMLIAQRLFRRDPQEMTAVPRPGGGFYEGPRGTVAKRICNGILAKRPDVIAAHRILAQIAHREGDLEEAAAHYVEILRINSTSLQAHNDLGDMRRVQGRVDEAISLYRKVIEIAIRVREDDPNMDRALVRLGRVDPVLGNARRSLAGLLFKQNKVAEAAEHYREAVRADPNNAKAHVVIGLDLANHGKYPEAVQALERALEIKPGYKPALRALDRIRARTGASTPP